MRLSVEVGNKYLSEALQKMLFECGYSWRYTSNPTVISNNRYKYLGFETDDKIIIGFETKPDRHHSIITLEQAVGLLYSKPIEFEFPHIGLKGCIDNVKKNIKVGCTTIPFDIAKQIYKLMEE